ncbi:MAG: DUF2461 domain-containing protein [Salinibacterium sp.]|nr:MAG: DUF2461 domain-containing protein [Salinibacterium sp.]
MAFTGFSPAAIDFYRGLEADNSRDYWLQHKAVYDTEVLPPMNALLEELEGEFGESKLFRPNRDIRFSNDKSPYKTSISAMLHHGGYLQLSARGLGVGVGCHTMAPDQLERYRNAVADDRSGEALRRALADVESKGIEIVVHDALKTAPRGYSADHPRADLLRNKSLTAWKQWPVDDWLFTADAKTHIVDALRGAKPLSSWLDEHVGATEMARR